MNSTTDLTLSHERIECNWIRKVSSYDTELSVYRLLHPLRQIYSRSSFGVVRHRITPETTPLDPITDVVQGLIHGIRIEKLKLDIDVSEQKIYSAVLEGFRAIEAAAQ